MNTPKNWLSSLRRSLQSTMSRKLKARGSVRPLSSRVGVFSSVTGTQSDQYWARQDGSSAHRPSPRIQVGDRKDRPTRWCLHVAVEPMPPNSGVRGDAKIQSAPCPDEHGAKGQLTSPAKGEELLQGRVPTNTVPASASSLYSGGTAGLVPTNTALVWSNQPHPCPAPKGEGSGGRDKSRPYERLFFA